MLQILLGEDSPCPKIKQVKIIPIPKFIGPIPQDSTSSGAESLTILEEGEFKVPIDGCISVHEIGFYSHENDVFCC